MLPYQRLLLQHLISIGGGHGIRCKHFCRAIENVGNYWKRNYKAFYNNHDKLNYWEKGNYEPIKIKDVNYECSISAFSNIGTIILFLTKFEEVDVLVAQHLLELVIASTYMSGLRRNILTCVQIIGLLACAALAKQKLEKGVYSVSLVGCLPLGQHLLNRYFGLVASLESLNKGCM